MFEQIFQNEFIIKSAISSLIVITGFIAGHFLSKAIGLLIKKIGLAEKIKKKGWTKPEILIENIVKYTIYVFAIIAALNRLGIFETVFSIILIIVATISIIVFVLSFRDFILNFLAGLELKGRIRVGRKIKTNDISGDIIKISLADVKIQTKEGDLIVLPYTYLLEKKFKLI